jgi:predicted HAD superfamily Cof-like phosphohydrolase
MFEFLESLFPLVHWESIESEVMARIGAARVNVDMPAFADACADIDYVVEGARIAFGIRGEPIADAVHDANMTKLLGPIVNGKKLKPAGWKAPDIEGLLREQGWTGGSR